MLFEIFVLGFTFAAATGDTLFPYGNATDNLEFYLPSGTFTSQEVAVLPIKFGGCYYNFIQISSFGYIRLLQNASNFTANDDVADRYDASSALIFLFNDVNPTIAPFAAYTAAIGNDSASQSYVVYSEHVGSNAMNAIIAKRLRQYHNYSSDYKFLPNVSAVVTFHRLKPAFGDGNGTITVQAVLASNGTDTYVLFNYGEYKNNETVWTGLPGKVGYSFGNVREPPSNILTSASTTVDGSSIGNTGLVGRWFFKIENAALCQIESQHFLPVDSVPYGDNLKKFEPTSKERTTFGCYDKLLRKIPIGGVNYEDVYIHWNGVFSLRRNISSLYDVSRALRYNSPLFGVTIIAPFAADFDTAESQSRVMYAQHTNETNPKTLRLLSKQLNAIRANNTLQPTFALTVTWHNMDANNKKYPLALPNPLITFQATLLTDGNETGLMFAYASVPGGIRTTNFAAGFTYGYANKSSSDRERVEIVKRKYLEGDEFYTNTNTGYKGLWYYKIETTSGDTGSRISGEKDRTLPTTTTSTRGPTLLNLLTSPQNSNDSLATCTCLPAGAVTSASSSPSIQVIVAVAFALVAAGAGLTIIIGFFIAAKFRKSRSGRYCTWIQ